MFRPKLQTGDRVRLLNMEGESIPPGTWGTVRGVFRDPEDGSDAYYVDWDNGDKDNKGKKISSLNLHSVDAWDLGGRPKKPIEEKWSQKYKKSINCKNPKGFSQKAHCQGRKKRKVNEDRDMETFIRNADIVKYFKVGNENYLIHLVRFLKLVQKSGITNMFGAAPFLYMGSEYIDRHYGDGMIGDDEAFAKVLEEADNAKNMMVLVTMRLIQDKYKIDSEKFNDDEDEDSETQSKILRLANKHIKDLSGRVLQFYMSSF
jgi:hypothetical protein